MLVLHPIDPDSISGTAYGPNQCQVTSKHELLVNSEKLLCVAPNKQNTATNVSVVIKF